LDQTNQNNEELIKALAFFCIGNSANEETIEDIYSSLQDLLRNHSIPYSRSGAQLLKRLKQFR
jgi:hypothetical protein